MKFYYNHCEQKLEAPEEMFGTEIACPACEQIVLVPFKDNSIEISSENHSVSFARDDDESITTQEPIPDTQLGIQRNKIKVSKNSRNNSRSSRQKQSSQSNNKKRAALLLSAIICLTFGTYSFSKIETNTNDNNISISTSESISVNEAHHESLQLTELKPFINKYCTDCHNAEKQKGNLRLDNVDYTLKKHSSVENWSNILDALNLSEMPPRKADQPQDKEMMMAIAALTEKLTVAHKTLAQTGGVIKMRHLNKREYRNNIRDLFGFHLPDNFMPDDITVGFDTNGSNQQFSYKDIENYLELGKWIVRTNIDTFHRDWRARRPYHKKWDSNPNLETFGEYFQYGADAHRYKFTIQAYSEEDVKAKITMGYSNVSGAPEIIGWLDLKAKKGKKQKFEIFHQNKKGHNGQIINIEVGRAKGAYIAEILREGPIREDSLFHDLIKSLPKENLSEQDIARILRTFAERAFRDQGVDPSYLNGLMSIYKTNKESGKDVLASLVEPFSIIISSPSFLYIKEKAWRNPLF